MIFALIPFQTSWFLSYILVVIALFQMLLFSFLGTVIEKKNSDVECYISNLLWYLMPVSEQKLLIPLTIKSQRSNIFEIGFVGLPLNVDTCVEVRLDLDTIMGTGFLFDFFFRF
jgi:hypothetical protein